MKIDAKILLIGTGSALKCAKNAKKRNLVTARYVRLQEKEFMIKYNQKQARG